MVAELRKPSSSSCELWRLKVPVARSCCQLMMHLRELIEAIERKGLKPLIEECAELNRLERKANMEKEEAERKAKRRAQHEQKQIDKAVGKVMEALLKKVEREVKNQEKKGMTLEQKAAKEAEKRAKEEEKKAKVERRLAKKREKEERKREKEERKMAEKRGGEEEKKREKEEKEREKEEKEREKEEQRQAREQARLDAILEKQLLKEEKQAQRGWSAPPETRPTCSAADRLIAKVEKAELARLKAAGTAGKRKGAQTAGGALLHLPQALLSAVDHDLLRRVRGMVPPQVRRREQQARRTARRLCVPQVRAGHWQGEHVARQAQTPAGPLADRRAGRGG